MIVQSPDTNMTEPYASYIAKRNQNIANVLEEVTSHDIQLCPRAILEEERVSKEGLVYGVVVNKLRDGLKSILYESNSAKGIAAANLSEAIQYSRQELQKGNRVRVKDSGQSDSQGQYIAENLDQVATYFDLAGEDCVLMPNIKEVNHRTSVGVIYLGSLGVFCYLGREYSTKNCDKEVYGGTEIGLFALKNQSAVQKVAHTLEIPSKLFEVGLQSIAKYKKCVKTLGRVSVDVLQGVTDIEEDFYDSVDITPRVGGATPAEVLAIKEVVEDNETICYANSRLIYDPQKTILTGKNFVNTDSLIINAEVKETTK